MRRAFHGLARRMHQSVGFSGPVQFAPENRSDVFNLLETEGVEKFEVSWNELLKETQAQLDSAAK